MSQIVKSDPRELAKNWQWRGSNGDFYYPEAVETSHLFFTFRMVWNNFMPEEARVGQVKLYIFSSHYTKQYLTEAIKYLGHELFNRKDLRNSWKVQLAQMKQYYNRQLELEMGP